MVRSARILSWLILICVFINSQAQNFAPSGRNNNGGMVEDTPPAKTRKPGSAWTLDYPLGSHTPSTIDTLLYNYQKQFVPSMSSDAYTTTGNYGAEGQTQIYFQRPERSIFFFDDALLHWLPTFKKQKFYNVYIPMTLLAYSTGGSKLTAQDDLSATFAGNVNRRIGIGAMMDYRYSRGSYENQAVKDFTFGFSGYYTGERYEMQAFYYHFNYLNKENGGITNDLYILDPAQLQGGVSKIEPKSIPTNLTSAYSRLIGDQFFMTHAYKIGYWKEEEVNDTLTREIYIPMIKFIYSFDYRSGHHIFANKNSSQDQTFWENQYIDRAETFDNTYYRHIANSFGISMVEGFRKWVKFGLSAYVTYEWRQFRQTPFDLEGDEPDPYLTPFPDDFSINPKTTQNRLWVGGTLTKQNGTLLNYKADAKFGLIGGIAGDIDINAEISSRFKLFKDTVSIKAFGFFKNKAQSFLLQHYVSNHFAWNNSFGKTRSFRIGGELYIPWSRTTLSAGVENIQNYVYFSINSLPAQFSGNIQVFSATLDQKLRFGIWNWDNRLTYQATSNFYILPLPALSLYSNMYLRFKAFKVLEAQIGVDCNYYTAFYAPAYQPALMTFHTQFEKKLGNYAFCDAYITAKLYKVRFFIMCSHVNQGLFSKNFFSSPHYPLNPRRFQLGLSVDFAN